MCVLMLAGIGFVCPRSTKSCCRFWRRGSIMTIAAILWEGCVRAGSRFLLHPMNTNLRSVDRSGQTTWPVPSKRADLTVYTLRARPSDANPAINGPSERILSDLDRLHFAHNRRTLSTVMLLPPFE